jgi:hypothetical protein
LGGRFGNIFDWTEGILGPLENAHPRWDKVGKLQAYQAGTTEKAAVNGDGLVGNECVPSHLGLVSSTFRNIMKEKLISFTNFAPFWDLHLNSPSKNNF